MATRVKVFNKSTADCGEVIEIRARRWIKENQYSLRQIVDLNHPTYGKGFATIVVYEEA